MSKKDAIRKHLKTNGSITPLEALSKYGLYRLGARILELRGEGMDIKTSLQLNAKTNSRYAKYTFNAK